MYGNTNINCMKILKFIKKIILVCLLILLIIISLIIFAFVKRIWSYYMSPWEVFEIVETKYTKNYKFNGLSFVDNENGILWGEYRDDDLLFTEDVTRYINEASGFIFESNNRGKNWRQIYKSKNEVVSISYVTNKLFFALVRVKTYDNFQEYFQILKFENDFDSFINLYTTKKLIKKIFFLNSDVGFIVGYKDKNENSTIIMMTKNGGKSWQTLQLNYEPDIYKQFIKYDDSKLYYFSDNKWVLLDINFIEENIIELPKGEIKIRHICLDDKKRLWFLSKTESKWITLFKENDNNVFERIRLPFENEELYPSFVHVYDNRIFIFLDDLKGFFPLWVIYTSSDAGLTWSEESIPLKISSELIAFYNEYIWVYSPGGRLQHRSIE